MQHRILETAWARGLYRQGHPWPALPAALKSCVRFFNVKSPDPAVYGHKPLVMVVHPVFKRKPFMETVWDAEEALGLARAARFDLLPGPSEPKGGWNAKEFYRVRHMQSLRDAKLLLLPGDSEDAEQKSEEEAEGEGEDSERFNRLLKEAREEIEREGHAQTEAEAGREREKDFEEEREDEEDDLNDPHWNNPSLKRQWAESCIVRIRHVDTAFLFGKGQVADLTNVYVRQPAHYVFINTQLTPTQQRNLGNMFTNALGVWHKQLYLNRKKRGASNLPSEDAYLDQKGDPIEPDEEREWRERKERLPMTVEVIDRYRVVLEIFQHRAHSKQAALQVLYARAQYLRTRLPVGSKTRVKALMLLMRSTLQSYRSTEQWAQEVSETFQAKGETYLQYERRKLEDLTKKVKEDLQRVSKTNEHNRERRRRNGAPVICIVGYTNAGKTALMNRLTSAGLMERDMLFQTLDTTMRRLRFPSGTSAILTDTIGFIQDLPHSLYDSFRVTLEEVLAADVLLHVRDIAHPQTEIQKQTVIETLHDAGLSLERIEHNMIEVWNKVDMLEKDHLESLADELPPNAVPVCARDGTGIPLLLNVLDKLLVSTLQRAPRTIAMPARDMGPRYAFLKRHSDVLTRAAVLKAMKGEGGEEEEEEDPQALEESLEVSADGEWMFLTVQASEDTYASYESRFGPFLDVTRDEDGHLRVVERDDEEPMTETYSRKSKNVSEETAGHSMAVEGERESDDEKWAVEGKKKSALRVAGTASASFGLDGESCEGETDVRLEGVVQGDSDVRTKRKPR
uniref:Hflx-type G domain-containing protein n=1 Tax=Chromera velia CCMP2878 TaxID=1169474 RepID=A0A0G4IDB4_9ALVE|eukprot:Cvel_13345.t1-p1 / transcript=Cvel_13345.t1 / gene=Cvel_13345 / organism=Chromera_velia_CCMP2878 / gene_product=Putative GTP-binding protein 6, putative / transcript_product=Putative GTP-binding protein 6, putative / location=Cvel_scaffold906:44654-52386(+) / protein_length=793 / sequence_SO=supercontig / SO=protein_coding / is_pseudo=false